MRTGADHLFTAVKEALKGGTFEASCFASMNIHPSKDSKDYVRLSIDADYVWDGRSLRELAGVLNRVADTIPE